MPPNAATISVAETLQLLDGSLAEMSEAIANGTYAFWLGSGISLGRVPGLRILIRKVLIFLQNNIEVGNPNCRFRRGLATVLTGPELAAMQPVSTHLLRAALLGWLLNSSIVLSFADTYPSRPITLIVHAAAGGSTDLVNRLIAEKVSGALGQPIVVEFRPGGGATIGATAVARARPDGYTIGFLGSSIAAAQGLGKPLTFDVREYVPLTQIINLRQGLQVSTSVPVRTLPELVALAKASPGKLNFGSTGFGSAPHIAVELFMQATGTKFTHVPYQSGAVAMQDLVSGRVDFYIDGTSIGIPLHRDGKIRILAVSGAERAEAASDIPTMREAGFGKAEYYSWGSWVMPPNTPAEIASKVGEAALRAAKDEIIRKRLNEVGVELYGAGPTELGAFIRAELAKYQELSRTAGIKLD